MLAIPLRILPASPYTKSAQIFDDMDRVKNLSKITREKQRVLDRVRQTGMSRKYLDQRVYDHDHDVHLCHRKSLFLVAN